jgi:HEPN domain-containing protein
MSEQENREDAIHWMRSAEQDIRAGEKVLAGEDPLANDACFHAQQAAKNF